MTTPAAAIKVMIEDAIQELERIRNRPPSAPVTSEEQRAQRMGVLLLLDEMFRIWGIERGWLPDDPPS